MNSYRSVFSLPEPAKTDIPVVKNLTSNYYSLLIIVKDFISNKISYDEFVEKVSKFN